MSLKKILIVEDEVIISMEIQERVKALGYDVVGTADSMAKAIEQAKAKKPDLCLMDIMLKGSGTGIDAAKVIYGELNIPIIFMTAYSDDYTLQRAKVVSPYGYILKPIDKDAMRIAMEIAIYKHSMELKLLVTERKFSKLFERAHIAVFISDNVGKISDANPALCKLLDAKDADTIKGRNICDFFENTNVEFNELIESAKKNNNVAKSDVKILTSNGEPKYVNAIINLVSGKKDDILLVEGFLDDITDRIAHEKFLEKEKEAAEKLANMKDEFLAGMSHEIRTPVNTILSYISLLSEEFKANMNEELDMILATINNGGKRLIRTIDMILNTADLNAGTFEPLKKEFDIYENSLKPLFHEFKEQARAKNLKFNIINNAKNVTVCSDIYSVTQIFSNLIDNSLKYTPEGKIDIVLENPAANLLSVKVVDTGKGISEEFLPHLFSAFTQEETGYRRKFDGTGLGMSLVKRYCDLISAEIEVKSKKNKGTTFNVIFKLS